MCGICGIVQVGGEPRELIPMPRLDAMTDVLRHRGPDARGTYAAPGIALGARRLAIVDVEGGDQPVKSEDGSIVAIQNGELYNHVEVRRELEKLGHRFTSRCDTEVIPHAYERDGLRFPEALRGKFAIALWDERRRRTVLVRDRLGVKPLYWVQHEDIVVFASEIKAVLASGLVPVELDVHAVDLYLTLGFVPGPRTLLTGVKKLAPGSLLVIDGDGARERAYWTFPSPQPEPRARPVEEYSEELLQLLHAAVDDRLMSDVPLGAMLSGGLDSSLVVALMANASASPVQTFSVALREDRTSELADARKVADMFGCNHYELELSVEDESVDLDELLWHLDEPVADLSALGFDLLCGMASQHVTVALAGQGADELFGGYSKHRAAAAYGKLDAIPPVVRRGLARAPWPSERLRRAFRAAAASDPSGRLLEMSGRLGPGTRATLYRGRLAEVAEQQAHEALERVRGDVDGTPLDVTLYLDAQLGLVDHMLMYFDKTSMAHSLEVRVPYLDHRLVEWASKLPSSMKVHRGVTKRVLKHAALRYLPPDIVDKRKIGFFRHAVDGWLRAQVAGEAGARLRSPDAEYLEFLDGAAVKRLLRDYAQRPSEDDARLVFAILLLESWLSSFRERAALAMSSAGQSA